LKTFSRSAFALSLLIDRLDCSIEPTAVRVS
jgi:hypothetical protein